ncbi:MAG: gamma-glutamyl-phosphate reductase, partial [Deltaproteobacteria bacterium]|nr:gamma-glutamyl-phosphate reductase [Deltaproteobacteria bacterium]
MTDNENGDVMRDIALKAKSMAQKLANLDTETKNKLLLHIRDNIQKNRDRISAANALDMTAARQMVDAGTLTPPLLNRLDLSAVKIDQLSTYLEQVAKLDDPVGKKQFAMKLAEDLELTRVSCPIGV